MTAEDRSADLPLIARHAEKGTVAYKLLFMWLFSMGGFGFLWWFDWLAPAQPWFVDWGVWLAGVLISVVSYLYLLNAEYFDWKNKLDA